MKQKKSISSPTPEPIIESTSFMENFEASKTVVSNDVKSTHGTSLRGHVKTTYEKLKSILGNPLSGHSGDGKINCEWILKFNCGSVATIYDWKASQTPTEEFSWSIGGTGSDVVKKTEMFLNIPTTPLSTL